MLSPSTVDLAGLERDELERTLVALGSRPFHARQLFQWVHKRGVTDVGRMTDLGQDLRARLAASTRSSHRPSSRQTVPWMARRSCSFGSETAS
jgi:adenine C2-methylase RlmN of 23S rRNA A2503 and tRNA A37